MRPGVTDTVDGGEDRLRLDGVTPCDERGAGLDWFDPVTRNSARAVLFTLPSAALPRAMIVYRPAETWGITMGV
jgi:hypothetical protein